MGKKYHSKKLKKKLQIERFLNEDSPSLDSPSKEKKIVKEPKTKETILSDIEIQIIDMFSRSFTNGEIGVKYPQQKKKGMMRLMNFCFRTIIEQAELYISPQVQKESHSPKYLDKKQRTIFYLSSNYRYKHIDKSLLQDFKIICKNYVKYHSLEHIDPKFIERFYKKILHNDFCFDPTATDPFNNKKPLQEDHIEHFNDQISVESEKIPPKYLKKPPKVQKVPEATAIKKPGAKRGRKRKHFPIEAEKPEIDQKIFQKQDDEISMVSLIQPTERELKSNRICIQKINIFLGYDTGLHSKNVSEEAFSKIQTHPFVRIEMEENQNRFQKGAWSIDMEAELIDQFMNTSASATNIVIRNLMKKFGRNKLFVESEILEKRKEIFFTSINKFISAFEGKTLCSGEGVRKMEGVLKGMSLSAKNYLLASFIHDFYFKEVKAISVTLLSEYMNKLNREEGLDEKGSSEEIEGERQVDKRKILERQDLKYALSTMSKLVENYNYELVK